MENLDEKLSLLANIAHILNKNHIVWAVGGSLLLYLKNKSESFHDIDLMVSEGDVEKLKSLLLPLGELEPPNPDKQYKTRHFLEFTINGIEVDILAGFVIVKDGIDYDCSLLPEQIEEYIQLNGESIPLQSLNDWRRYYQLMGRAEKVKMIDA